MVERAEVSRSPAHTPKDLFLRLRRLGVGDSPVSATTHRRYGIRRRTGQ